jgi:hypothetical protein
MVELRIILSPSIHTVSKLHSLLTLQRVVHIIRYCALKDQAVVLLLAWTVWEKSQSNPVRTDKILIGALLNAEDDYLL